MLTPTLSDERLRDGRASSPSPKAASDDSGDTAQDFGRAGWAESWLPARGFLAVAGQAWERAFLSGMFWSSSHLTIIRGVV